MKHLMTETVLPYLRMRAGHQGIIRRRVLRTVGIGESTIDDKLQEYMTWSNPTVGLAAHTAQCDVRITARAEDAERAERMIDELEAEIRSRIGDFIYSTTSEETIEAVVGRLLQVRGATVSLLETNTQGHLAKRLAATEGVVVFSGVPGQMEGASIPQNVWDRLKGFNLESGEAKARDVAVALRQATGATYGVALLGSSGADEGVYGSSHGFTWLGLARPGGVTSQLLRFGGSDDYTVVRIGNQALVMLWQLLK
jgi:nicotinamide-nucleotide amidase